LGVLVNLDISDNTESASAGSVKAIRTFLGFDILNAPNG
jgi:hypothetical protein